MKRHYCTYFNSGYLGRALALIESMQRHAPEFTLDVLCFDDDTYDYFTLYPVVGVRAERLRDFEVRNGDVAAVKGTRSRGEYFFTCTGAWVLDVLQRHPEIDILTYLDADLYFFSSPEPVFELFSGKDILITEHRFSLRERELIKYGRFNVGWLSFRNNEVGCRCLRRWRDLCVSWCFDRLEDGKFADQKYLDDWPEAYGDRLMVASPGLNAGPWTINSGGLSKDDAGKLYVDGDVLVTYHYQGIRVYSPQHFYAGYIFEHQPFRILEWLYFPYVRDLVRHADVAGTILGAHSRYKKERLLGRLAMGYWLDSGRASTVIWLLQRVVLSIFGRKRLLWLVGR